MTARGTNHLRHTTNQVLDALLTAAERAYRDRPPTFDSLHAIVENLKTSAAFDSFYAHAWSEAEAIQEDAKLEAKRNNAFGRLMIHPLSELLNTGQLDRAHLPNLFQFLHLILGDDNEEFGRQCREIVEDLKSSRGADFSWQDLYDHPLAKRLQWQTLVRIAHSFKRWDLRKEWFMKLMQYTPTSVSVGQAAFVVKDKSAQAQDPGEHRVFGENDFHNVFTALFHPLTSMTRSEEEQFIREFKDAPHHLIGPFLVNLAKCQR